MNLQQPQQISGQISVTGNCRTDMKKDDLFDDLTLDEFELRNKTLIDNMKNSLHDFDSYNMLMMQRKELITVWEKAIDKNKAEY